MANQIILKKSSVTGKVPLVGDLAYGELAINYSDGKLYFKTSGNSIAQFVSSGNYAASGGLSGLNYLTKASNYTALSNDYIIANSSSGPFTITLPASPASGDVIVVADQENTLSSNPVTVDRNGSTIQGVAGNLVLNVSGYETTFIYDGTTWLAFSKPSAKTKNPLLLTLTGPASGTEGTTVNIVIDNYDPAATYDFSVSGGAATRTFEVIAWTLPSVSTDTIHVLSASRTLSGSTRSTTFAITVVNVSTIADGFVGVTDFTDGVVYNTGWTY